MSETSSAKAATRCTVYYDGACPVCQREITLYQRLDQDRTIKWHDLSAAETGRSDLSTEQALARFHVQRKDGTLVTGAAGFAEVMKTIPSLRWLGITLSFPPIAWITERFYRLFLLIRPSLKNIVRQSRHKPRHDG